MPKIDLQFSAVMQSWGLPEQFSARRRTASEPTKTALTGLIGRAMGVDREDTEKLHWIFDNITDIQCKPHKHIQKMIDDQLVHNRKADMYPDTGFVDAEGKLARPGGKGAKPFKGFIFTKEYLIDTVSDPIVITISGSEDFLTQVRDALEHPVWPCYIGRYCCIPAKPFLVDGKIY